MDKTLKSKGNLKWQPELLSGSTQPRAMASLSQLKVEKMAFVHISAVERSGLTTLTEGQKVEYEMVEGRNGKENADSLKVLG